jgi:acetyl-CoA C-acetyltransferase
MNTVRGHHFKHDTPAHQCAHQGALIYELIRRDVHRGIAALCLGGGNAVAMAVER